MRALLLCAGIGSRLGTSEPKVLSKAGNKTFLQRHVDSLGSLGIGPDGITAVTGFRRGLLESACRERGIASVFNPCWRFPGTLGSFHMYKPSDGDLLVIHGDLVWEPDLLAGVFNEPGDIVLPVDPAQRRDSEAMKAETRDGLVLHLSKTLPAERSSGESMGVFLIRKHRKLFELVKPIVHKPHSSLDDGVNLAIGRMLVRTVLTQGCRWEEVDTPVDLERAGDLFCE